MDFSLPSNPQEERGEVSTKEHSDLLSSLPKHKGFFAHPLRMYKGFWVHENMLPRVMALQDHFKPRPSDLILVTQPKSGTTWLKALLFAIMNRTNYTFAQHPLLTRNPHACVLFLEVPFRHRFPDLEAIPPPRLLATHLPYSILPSSVADCGCRLVYLCRDPKDVVVSLWHFAQKLKPDTMGLSEAFELFCDGFSFSGPIWDHMLEYWRESLRRSEKVLFLKYEEMMTEPVGNVRRLAEFVGRPFSEEEEKDGVVEEIVQLCSFEKLSNMEVNKKGVYEVGETTVPHESFFRKGKVGDWANHLSREMGEALDRIVQEKLAGSGLTFQAS
ncbi:cytosolic sulfotransferase 12-like [Phoenix dactylifera]|uniref:Sulfotransferase n=1 Tax=Phoenix dactylifera TaxID=42345 RepID=A0A8B7BM30_PHODC|nr:cytosolic sulfotransferase 12-like [Phoenix dactylifera]